MDWVRPFGGGREGSKNGLLTHYPLQLSILYALTTMSWQEMRIIIKGKSKYTCCV